MADMEITSGDERNTLYADEDVCMLVISVLVHRLGGNVIVTEDDIAAMSQEHGLHVDYGDDEMVLTTIPTRPI